MSTLRELPPRDLGRALMRGDRAELKLGYTAANATLAARRLHQLSESQSALLEAYLDGFSAGMCHQPKSAKDVGLRGERAGAYEKGVADGVAEPIMRTYPAEPESESAR